MQLDEKTCVLLARRRLSPSDRDEAIALASQGVNWDQVIELAVQQEVYPLVYRNLNDLGFPGVPVKARERLKVLYQANALRSELLARELARLLAAFEQAGIHAIPLKGPFLAESLYGEAGLRVCADLDILVPRASMLQAFDLLLSSGYRSDLPRWVVLNGMLRSCIQLPVLRPAGAMHYVVEIHWGFLESSPESLSFRDLWAEARRETFRGKPVWTLSPEWQALFLLVHAARHNWQGLKWLSDLHEITVQGGIQWDVVAAKSRMMGWEPLVQWGLGVCHAVLGTRLPSNIPLQLPHSCDKLFAGLRSPNSRWKSLLVLLRAEPRLYKKLGLLTERLFVPTTAEYSVLQLPASLWFLYYILRPIRLCYSVGRSPLG